MIEMEQIQKFIDRMEERIDLQVSHVSKGSCEDFADYAGNCGIINGLRMSLNILETVLSTSTDEDED